MNAAIKKRKNVVRQAVANQRLEGLRVSKKARSIAENYVVGKMTARQAAAKIRARYGVL